MFFLSKWAYFLFHKAKLQIDNMKLTEWNDDMFLATVGARK